MTDNHKVFSALNGYFDYIYVLTLTSSIERQNNVNKVLSGLNWSFFFGIDKANLDPSTFARDNIYDDQRHKNTKRTTRGMNLGEVACSLSHRSIFQDMLDKGFDRVLILEDDVLPEYDNLRRFNQVMAQLPTDWEVMMLGYYGEKLSTWNYRLQRSVYRCFHRLHLFNWHKVSTNWINQICLKVYSDDVYEIGKVVGAHAYAVRANAAKKFIDYQTPVILQADRIFNYYKAENELKAFAPKQKMFTLSELSKKSSIQ
jgi:glycosyl transferase family 25